MRSRALRCAVLCAFVGCSRPQPDSAVEWDRPISVAAGEAHRGPWRMNESDFRWVDDPAVHATQDGVALAWADQAQKDIFFRRFVAGKRAGLSKVTRVSKTPETFSWLPRMVVAAGTPETIFVIWQEIVFSGGSHGGEILFARSLDAGETFEAPLNLSESTAGDGKGRLDADTWDNGSLDLARSAAGALYAVWTEYEGALWFRHSRDGGKSFSAALRLGGSREFPARAPSVAVAPNGWVYVAWATGESRTSDIQYSISTDGGGSFAAPRSVHPTNEHSDAPKLAVDRTGTVHLAYAEASASASHIAYSRLASGATAFEPPRRLSAEAGARYPQLALDARGWVYLLWEHYAGTAARATGLVFTYSRDRGRSFRPASRLSAISGGALGFNGSQQGSLLNKLAITETGALAVVNSTFQPDRRSEVWLLYGRLD